MQRLQHGRCGSRQSRTRRQLCRPACVDHGSARPMTSLALAELVRRVSRGEQGFYIPGPIQELLLRRHWRSALTVSGRHHLAHRSCLRHPHKRLRSHPLRHPARPRLLLTWGDVAPARMHPAKRRLAPPPRRLKSPPRALTCRPTLVGLTTPRPGHHNCHCKMQPTRACMCRFSCPRSNNGVSTLLLRPGGELLLTHCCRGPFRLCTRCWQPSTTLHTRMALPPELPWHASRNGQRCAGPAKSHGLQSSCAKWGNRPSYHLCGPLHDVLLALLLGANTAATLAHRLDALRAPLPACSSPAGRGIKKN